MIIYKDIITGDELLSDGFDIKEVDDLAYEVDCAMVSSDAADVDTVTNEDGDCPESAVNELVQTFRLQPTSFLDQYLYFVYLKGLSAGYIRAASIRLRERGYDSEELHAFRKGVTAYAKRVHDNFEDWEFYTGESMDTEGMVVLLGYREDGVTPFVSYFKHGLTEEEV